jgi:penicillin amidase
VSELGATLGDHVASWRWARVHTTRPEHPLAAAFPSAAARLNPPAVAMGGDGDTVQAASFIASAGYGLTSTSVARYVFDLGDWERSAWIVPLGASGHPGSAHYADQTRDWASCRLLPMRYDWTGIAKNAESQQTLEPAG